MQSKEDDAAGSFNAILEQKQRRAIRLDADLCNACATYFMKLPEKQARKTHIFRRFLILRL